MSAIFVDNLCDLGEKELKKLGLNLVELSVDDPYKTAFMPYLDEEEDIIYIATDLKKRKSGFERAIKSLNNSYNKRQIKTIDLNSMSVCAGLVAYEAGLAYRRGCTDYEITQLIEKFKTQVHGFFVTQSHDFLQDCNGIEKINNNSLLNLIFPIVFVRAQKCDIVDKAQGKKRSFSTIIKLTKEYGKNMADYPIIIGYYDDEANANFLKDELIKHYGGDTAIFTLKLTEENAKRFGKNAILMAFYSKNK